jgi:mRNA interferase MazF
MTYSRGDVVLVKFIFSDETGAKRRPAVVVSSEDYQQGRREAIIAAVTSNTKRPLTGDHTIASWRAAGLLYPSVSTGIIRTIKHDMIARRIGRLGRSDLREVSNSLRSSLGLTR